MIRLVLLVGLLLAGCTEQEKPEVVGKTFCKNGALYEIPPWKTDGGFLVFKDGKYVACTS